MHVKFVKRGTFMANESDCRHPSVLFFEDDCTFRCMKCNEKLIRLENKFVFRIFCKLIGFDPENLLA